MPVALVGSMRAQIFKSNLIKGITFRADRKSALGNPYAVPNERVRKQAVFDYGLWLIANLSEVNLEYLDPTIFSKLDIATYWRKTSCSQIKTEYMMLKKLYDESTIDSPLTILCWCEPLLCHVSEIIKCLEKQFIALQPNELK